MADMNVTVLLFASARDAAGASRVSLTLVAGATAQDARARLVALHPGLARVLPTCRTARNRELVSDDTPLSEGDELALIPPVSGGSGARAQLTHLPMTADAATTLLTTDGAGALVTFTGTVRNTSKAGRAVTDLTYEAYEPMALEQLEVCLAEARAQWPILDAAVIHRLGALTLGDVAVSIAVAAKHRAEAFAACAHIIDRIKQLVPIWKKETGPDGSAWVSEGA